jgi:glycosyltransferase involved in cell wall biosynthesis
VPVAAAAADLILCDSEFVRNRVVRRLGVPEERTLTVHLAPGHAFRPAPADEAHARLGRLGLEGAFILHVGSIEPRKNHVRLIEAFEEVRRRGIDARLVLVGSGGWRNEAILERIDGSRESASIVRLRDLDDRDLADLYAACAAFVLPSLEEGFGLPLAEAMACGAPCVAADNSSLTEIAGDGARLVPATDAGAIAAALIDLCGDPAAREAWRARALARAGRWRREDWERRMLGIYRGLIDSAAPRALSSAQ